MTDAFSQLLDDYLARADAGETLDEEQIARDHPEHAAALWKHMRGWKNVALALPDADADAEPKPAIEFQSLSLDKELDGAPVNRKSTEELARRMASRKGSIQRYRVVEEIARGAMGAIVRVTDRDLGRDLAMKVVLSRADVDADGLVRQAHPAAVARFVEEARITGRLEHPGIPSVHDFGVDSRGNFYFTLPWIRGETLADVLTRVRAGEEGWNRTRVLRMMLQICDAMAYAHSEGIIHRDIKPRNVMVGEFGEVLVMDWGLARDCSRPEVADIQLATPESPTSSPIMTREGVVLGTPCYMSPEQARGEMKRIGPQTDVYAVGSMLYELLLGHPPYASAGSKTPAHGIVRMVQEGPPPGVLSERRDVPPELVAVCERAMARSPEERYTNMAELGGDLRDFLDGRVVRSFQTGAWIEFHKWVRRNPGVAGLAALLVAVLVGSAFGLASVERSRRMSIEHQLERGLTVELLESFAELGPIAPDQVESRKAWLASAEQLVANQAMHEELLATFESDQRGADRRPASEVAVSSQEVREAHRAELLASWTSLLPTKRAALNDPSQVANRDRNRAKIAAWEYELPRLEVEVANDAYERSLLRTWGFEDPALDRQHADLWNHVANLKRLSYPASGEIARVRTELALASNLRANSTEAYAGAWTAAIASIADPDECALYAGLTVTPQVGLVPLARNSAGLWEFWLVLSGTRPAQLADGNYEFTPESGMVFVLVPGGARPIGAQSTNKLEPNFADVERMQFPALMQSEAPVRSPQLDAYFLSKYEMTQAQWLRLSGYNPSDVFSGGSFRGSAVIMPTNPVEHVSRDESIRELELWGLRLPTEAQWEVAARAGTHGAYWWGNSWPPPEGAINFLDRSASKPSKSENFDSIPSDGNALHVVVTSHHPNPWGFYNILGNVSEWCCDWFTDECNKGQVLPGTGELVPGFAERMVIRGGSFRAGAEYQRVSRRDSRAQGNREPDAGIRPVILIVK